MKSEMIPLDAMRGLLVNRLVDTLASTKLPPAKATPWEQFTAFVRPVLLAAGVAAFEADRGQVSAQVRRKLVAGAMRTLERVTRQFQANGTVTPFGDMNTGYFTLVPFTFALRSLQAHISAYRHQRLLTQAETLYDDAAGHIDRTHDYLNPRGLEALSAYNLYKLTGRKELLDRSVECLDELITRQYPCGAQPYHTGSWIWGRKPSQGYQYLTAGMMLLLGKALEHHAAVDYVRRLMDYALLATNRHGEAFVTVFEGLHKAHSGSCAGRQWTLAAGLNDPRYAPLGAAAYRIWCQKVQAGISNSAPNADAFAIGGGCSLDALLDGLHMGLDGWDVAPDAAAFVPVQGVHALPDISSLFVHQPKLDVAMTLLTGYSALAEADCGNVKLFALTPELTDTPTHNNAGTDPLRADWTKPSEQDACFARQGRAVLRGRVYTKWDKPRQSAISCVHNRRLVVSMTWRQRELILEYRTDQNFQDAPVPSRLLFLLIARPEDRPAVLRIGSRKHHLLASHSTEAFTLSVPVAPVQYLAPDGSFIEIIPEVCASRCLTVEHPPYAPAKRAKERKSMVKSANEGSLRLCFEGPETLDRGRFRIRFSPA